MDLRAKCVAVIPCFNEQAAISRLVEAVRPLVGHVLVIDDGSTDHTGEIARAAGAEVIQHKINQGKGAALRTGLLRAVELKYEWGFLLDGDGQHSPGDMQKFYQCARETNAKLVVGNRMPAADSMPWLRRFVNRWMSKRLSNKAGRRLPDSQCGFRLVDLAAWSSLRFQTEHFEIESEMLLAFIRAGHRVEFVPIEVIYKNEQSKIHPVRDTIRWFRWWFGRD